MESENTGSIIVQFFSGTLEEEIDALLRGHKLKIAATLSKQLLQFSIAVPKESISSILETLRASRFVKYCHQNRRLK